MRIEHGDWIVWLVLLLYLMSTTKLRRNQFILLSTRLLRSCEEKIMKDWSTNFMFSILYQIAIETVVETVLFLLQVRKYYISRCRCRWKEKGYNYYCRQVDRHILSGWWLLHHCRPRHTGRCHPDCPGVGEHTGYHSNHRLAHAKCWLGCSHLNRRRGASKVHWQVKHTI